MQINKPLEEDHFVRWIDTRHASKILFHDHQSWAVQRLIKLPL